MNNWQKRLGALDVSRLMGMRRGIEKESLRATPDGRLAMTPHPAGLGSALTHPHVTTDFSESQLELITGVEPTADDALRELTEIHQAVYRCLGDELMWASSMPCVLPDDGEIPLGQYGSANIGRAKTVYRMGLGHRYGRRMQTISGIHYNWSLPGVDSDDYFALIRNFRRHSFLLLLLFGASPALCGSFVRGREHGLQDLLDAQGQPRGSLYLPHATSLRMGRLGYKSDAQSSLAVSYNSLEGYAASLNEALSRPYAPYQTLGIQDANGRYQQLSTTLLQIENEFYGTIRPKRVIRSGERPLHALRERGVQYVEVRCMDLDPFEPVGINAATMRFIDIFLLHCLVSDSPPDTPAEIAALARNQLLTASSGREPGLKLERGSETVELVSWAQELLSDFAPIAARLDDTLGGSQYAEALAMGRARLAAPASLPSARVLQSMVDEHGASHIDFVRHASIQAREHLLALPATPVLLARFDRFAQASRAEQARLEASDTLPFEAFRLQYLAPSQLQA